MLPFWLTTFALVGAQQAPSPCTLAGPTVEARWTGTVPRAATAAAPLQLVADHPLPGTTSRFDYQSLEPDAGRLFISHMGAGQLVVFHVQDRGANPGTVIPRRDRVRARRASRLRLRRVGAARLRDRRPNEPRRHAHRAWGRGR